LEPSAWAVELPSKFQMGNSRLKSNLHPSACQALFTSFATTKRYQSSSCRPKNQFTLKQQIFFKPLFIIMHFVHYMYTVSSTPVFGVIQYKGHLYINLTLPKSWFAYFCTNYCVALEN
jgi:hypothetical protein